MLVDLFSMFGFLSRLFGGEPLQEIIDKGRNFLSRLFGGEQEKRQARRI